MKPTPAEKADVLQPASAMTYAVIALIGLVLALAFTLFYIYQVPRLVQNGAQSQVFYLLLIPWALSCAAFLFGTMKSYAGFTYKRLGSALELGGPVVLFCLVLIGGFKLVPSAPETFDLTVRAHSEDGRNPLITSGKVTIELDTALLSESFGSNGEADFKAIPPKFEHATSPYAAASRWLRRKMAVPQSTGETRPRHTSDKSAAQPVTLLTGSISVNQW